MRSFGSFVGGVLSFLLGLSSASADVPPPDLCDDVGRLCTAEGELGVCEETTCTRIDYGSWNRETDGAPPMTSYPCNRCTAAVGGSDSSLPRIGVFELGSLCCCVLTLSLLALGGAFLLLRKKKPGE